MLFSVEEKHVKSRDLTWLFVSFPPNIYNTIDLTQNSKFGVNVHVKYKIFILGSYFSIIFCNFAT